MTIPARLSLITLGARDPDSLGAFYDRVGWTLGPTGDDGFRSYLLRNVVVSLYPLETLGAEAAPGEPLPAPGWNGVTFAINVDEHDEVDRVWGAMVEAGATPVAEPRTMAWGGRSSYVADPEGNRWEIAWNEGLVADANGIVERFGDARPG